MHLVLCPDDNYAEHAAVMLASVFANISEPHSLKVWVVANGLEVRSRRLLARAVRRGRGQIEFLTIDAAPLKDAPRDGHITLASYYRLLAPLYLPEEVDRFLYLDSDVVVEDDIAPLFAVDLAGNVLAAVGNPCNWHAQIGLPPKTRYFNAGVLMVDHRRWQAERVSERVIAVIAEKAGVLRYWDQDALNCVISGRWTVLDPVWNQQHYFRNMAPKVIGYGAEQWKRTLERPSLIHFTGESKPWHVKNGTRSCPVIIIIGGEPACCPCGCVPGIWLNHCDGRFMRRSSSLWAADVSGGVFVSCGMFIGSVSNNTVARCDTPGLRVYLKCPESF